MKIDSAVKEINDLDEETSSSSSTPDHNQRSHCSIFFASAILQRKSLEAKIKNEVDQRRRIKHGRRNNKKVSIQKDGVLFKVDFKKGIYDCIEYDYIEWDYLEYMLVRKVSEVNGLNGCGPEFLTIICQVLVNGNPTEEFKVGCSLRQGNLLASSLYIPNCGRRISWIIM